MSTENKIQIEFEAIQSNWVPITFSYKDYQLELIASYLFCDPMVQLCDALIEICKGIKEPSPVSWDLESYCYHLQLVVADEQYKVIILEGNGFYAPATITREISGSFHEIILPLYRALKKFWSYSSSQSTLNKLESQRIEQLTKLMKKMKQDNTL
jgi:hypothetical protein